MPTFEVLEKPEIARLVRFSTGKLNPEAKDQLKFHCYHVKDEEKIDKTKTVITTELNGLKYSGQNFGSSNHFSTDLCDYYVAIHRKGADKVQIVPAEIFQLQPRFEEKHVHNEQSAELSFVEKRNDLIKQFGSGQLQRKVNKLERTKMEEGMVTSTTEVVANKYISSASFSEHAESPSAAGDVDKVSGESRVVPPHNKNATRPEDVYLLETIIPHWVGTALAEQSEPFVLCTTRDIKQWRENKEYSEVVLNLLENLPTTAKERNERCPCIMYLHCLIHSYHMKAGDFAKINEKYPSWWKIPVRKLLDEQFVVQGFWNNRRRSTRPMEKKDLTLSHILVLYMRLCNYEISLKPLQTELKISMPRLTLHATMLGFRIRKSKEVGPNQVRAVLSLPLEFPKPGPKKGAGQKRK